AGATALIYLILLIALVAVLIVVVPLLIAQIAQLANQLPTLASGLPRSLRALQLTLDRWNVPIDVNVLTGPGLAQQASQFGSRILENSVQVASSIASTLFDVTIVLILSFYLALDGDRFVQQVLAAVPPPYTDDARQFVYSIDRSFGGFLRGTAIQAAFFGIGTAVIMQLGGLHYVLLASLFAAVIMVIPFIGPLLAAILPLLIAIFSGLPTTQFIAILVALVGLQILVMNIIAPKVMSENVGLHPLLVFLALLVGAKQAGVAGAIFGVPVAAVIWAAIRILLRRWAVIGPAPAPLPLANGRPRSHAIRLDRLSFHLGGVVNRIFHSKIS
ncbi:MAG TPA: AI-2E family transporter, partial [Chloroflexota bacterium]|nr:AI-2E family transporter [Chloroflexota bacterium]